MVSADQRSRANRKFTRRTNAAAISVKIRGKICPAPWEFSGQTYSGPLIENRTATLIFVADLMAFHHCIFFKFRDKLGWPVYLRRLRRSERLKDNREILAVDRSTDL